MRTINHAQWQKRSDSWIEMLEKSRCRKARELKKREHKLLQQQISLTQTPFRLESCPASPLIAP